MCPKKPRSVLDYHTVEDLRQALVVPQSSKSKNSESSVVANEAGKQPHQGTTDWILKNYDDETTYGPSVEHEVQRLQNLKSYAILDSQPEDRFDQITEFVRLQLSASWACLSFVDLGRQWIKSSNVEGCKETAREHAFCAHSILQKNGETVMVVADTLNDERFCNNPFVVGGLKLRFYAGAALVTPEGEKIGTLCVFDSQPRDAGGLTQQERQLLKKKANEAVQLLVERKERMDSGKRTASEAQIRKNSVTTSAPTLLGWTASSGSSSPPLKLAKGSNHGSEKDGSENPGDREETKDLPFIPLPPKNVDLPDPKKTNVGPDVYLAQLAEAMYGLKVKVRPALELKDFFRPVSEDQVAAYSLEVVAATRTNNVEKLKTLDKAKLDCFNRFGEGLLNIACRRGYKEMVEYLLEDVGLPVRLCDDCGRTPLHDACWHPEPQLEICGRLLDEDPSLFLISDKRGFTAFQYARNTHWHLWRQFLFDNRQHLGALTHPEMLSRFS